MATLFSYLITMFAAMFWVFRIVVAFTDSLSMDFFIQPIDLKIEVIILFVTLFCLVFIVKRKVWAALVYLITYGAYFGKDIYDTVTKMMSEEVGGIDYFSTFVSCIGMLIAVLVFMDVVLNKNRKGSSHDKKTDWFYKNKEYDRNLDSRADNNQYKIR